MTFGKSKKEPSKSVPYRLMIKFYEICEDCEVDTFIRNDLKDMGCIKRAMTKHKMKEIDVERVFDWYIRTSEKGAKFGYSVPLALSDDSIARYQRSEGWRE